MKREKKINSIKRMFMRCNVIAIIAMVLMSAALVGCRSSKKATTGTLRLAEIEKSIMPALSSVGDNLSAKVKFDVNLNGKELSLNGNIKVKRGEGIIASINALGGIIEVARVELTPKGMLLLYRLGKQYVRVDYDEVDALRNLGFDYSMLEAIFLNELFAPEGKSFEKAIADIKAANGEIVLTTKRSHDMQYSFHIEQSSGNLVLTRGDYDDRINVDCNYSDFTTLNGRAFPKQIRFAVAGSALDMRLSNIKNSEVKLSFTKDLSSYAPADLSGLMKKLKQ